MSVPCRLRSRKWLVALAGALLVAAAPALAQTHLDNPFAGAKMYVNPDYTANANATAATTSDASLAAAMRTVGQQPTAVWFDRIAVVPSLSTHLDNALAQGANLFLGVVYDLPGRDCAALASNGELALNATDFARYKTEYIDAIAAVIKQSKYANLRIVLVVEPDSLPNLVTNLGTAACAQAQSTGYYVQGVQYAVNTLHALPNVYLYIDMAHSGWLGWSNNSSGFVNLMNTVASGFTGGKSAIDGFVDDTANTLPLKEPYLTATQTVAYQQVMNATFYQSNPDIDETSYVADMYSRFTAAGWPSSLGILMDTSRNGWGGSQRPRGASTSTDLNTFVNQSKIDRRAHRGLWCNPLGAGIGERPAASPGIAHVDAYVWVKPPGESDGASSDIPNTEGKKFDRMCDPTYTTQYGVLTGATPDAPLSGKWFATQFATLVANAYPPLTPTFGNTLTVTRTGNGTVTSTPAGINCGNTCSASFSDTTTVTLSAQAASGASFTGWTGCTASGTTCTVSMTAARSVTAAFTGGTGNTLAVTKTGNGTVTSTPSGIDCGATCSASFPSTATVTLTAQPASGASFTSWGGACSGAATTCTVAMSAARTVTATFTGGGTTPCNNPVTFTGNTSNFNTTGAVCYRTSATINGWGCYNMDGRTITNGGATRTCGQVPLTKSADGYTYFAITAGTYAWAGMYTY